MFGSEYGHGPRCPGGDWRLEPSQHPHGHTALGRRLPCSRDLSVLLPSEKLEALNGRVRFRDHSQVAGLHLKSGSSPRVFRVEITGACAARGFWLCCRAAVGCVFLLPAFDCSIRESAPHLAPQCLRNRVSASRETRLGGSLFSSSLQVPKVLGESSGVSAVFGKVLPPAPGTVSLGCRFFACDGKLGLVTGVAAFPEVMGRRMLAGQQWGPLCRRY